VTAPDSHQDFTLPADAHALVRQTYSYWQALHPAPGRLPRPLPGRQHVEPTAIPKLLSHLWMLDVVPAGDAAMPLRFRYRLLGTDVRRVLPNGESVIGRWLHEIDPDFLASGRYDAFAAPVLSRQPSWRRGAPKFPHGLEHLTLERLFLPLASDGQTVDLLLCISLFLAADGKLMDPP